MAAPTTEERFTRGRMVQHRLILNPDRNIGRVLGIVQDYRGITWVVVAFPGGLVSCVRCRNLELLTKGDTP